MNVKKYTLKNSEKVDRALNGTLLGNGSKIGGIVKEDGSYDDDALLAEYDKLGGLITNNDGDIVKTGSFYDFKNKKAKTKAEVMLTFKINGRVVDVPEGKEMPKIVEASRIVEQDKKKKKNIEE